MLVIFKQVVHRAVGSTSMACAVALMLAALAAPAVAVLPAPPAPEIDPGSLAGAVALVVGGVMLVRGRIRR